MAEKKRWLTKKIWGFGLTSLFNDYSHEMTTALLPSFVESLTGAAMAPTYLGVISGVSNGFSTIVRLWAGWLSDKIANHKLFLFVGYAITPLFSALIGTAQRVGQVLLYRTIAWTGRGIREPVRDAWLANIVDPSKYGHVFGFNRALDTVGAILGPLTVFFALKFWDIRTIFLVSIVPGVLSVLSLLVLVPQEKEHIKVEHRTETWLQHLEELPKNFKYFTLVMFIFGIANFNKTLIIYRAQEIFTGETQSNLTKIGLPILLYALFNMVRAISEYSVGILSDMLSRKKLLAFLGFGLFGIVNLALIFSAKSMLLWGAIFALSGISIAAVTTLQKAYAADLLPADMRGIGYGLLETINGIGDLLSSIIVGSLWTVISPTIGFIYAAILSFLATVLLIKSR